MKGWMEEEEKRREREGMERKRKRKKIILWGVGSEYKPNEVLCVSALRTEV